MKIKLAVVVTFVLLALNSSFAGQKRDAYRCTLFKKAGSIQSYEMTQFDLIDNNIQFWHEFEDVVSQVGAGISLDVQNNAHKVSIVTVNRNKADEIKEYSIGLEKNQKVIEFYAKDSGLEVKLSCFKIRDVVLN